MTKEKAPPGGINRSAPTPIIHLRQSKLQASAVLAAKFLLNGGVVATPTDTIYGIAALVQNRQAVQKIYEIKGKILIVLTLWNY